MRIPFGHRLALSLAALLTGLATFAPATLAADVTGIGFVDQAALSNV